MTVPKQDMGPQGNPCRRTTRFTVHSDSRYADTNQYGDTFGGWLLGQMDIAGGIFAAGLAKGRTATVAVDRNDVPQSRVRRRRHVARKAKGDGRKVRGVNDLRGRGPIIYTIKPSQQSYPVRLQGMV